MSKYKPKNNFKADLLSGAAGSGFAAILTNSDAFQFVCIAALGGLAAASVMWIVQQFVYWKLLPPATQLLSEKVCPDCLTHGTLTELHRSVNTIAIYCESCHSHYEIEKTEAGVTAKKIGTYDD